MGAFRSAGHGPVLVDPRLTRNHSVSSVRRVRWNAEANPPRGRSRRERARRFSGVLSGVVNRLRRDQLRELGRDVCHWFLYSAQTASRSEQRTDVAESFIRRFVHDGDLLPTVGGDVASHARLRTATERAPRHAPHRCSARARRRGTRTHGETRGSTLAGAPAARVAPDGSGIASPASAGSRRAGQVARGAEGRVALGSGRIPRDSSREYSRR